MLSFEQEPAYILHRTPYQEHRYLLELLTLNHGRMRGVARITQHKTHRQTGQFAPFRLLHITGTQKHELATFHASEVITTHAPHPEEALNLWYMHELCRQWLPLNTACASVFTVYQSALHSPDAAHLRLMEYTLIHHLDLLPEIPPPAAYYQIHQSALGLHFVPSDSGFAHQLVHQLYQAPSQELLTNPALKALCQSILRPSSQTLVKLKTAAKKLQQLRKKPS